MFDIIVGNLIMVIPKFARQNGITVHLYVLSAVALTSLAFSLATSHPASALFAINNIPIVGQPIADLVNGVKDGIVKPAMQSVTSLLPQPISSMVQAPVNAITRVADPIVGPSSQSLVNQRSTQRQQQTQSATIIPATTERSLVEQQPAASPEQAAGKPDGNKYSKLSGDIAAIDKHTPVLGVTTKNFAATKDSSVTIAAGSVLLVMALLFVGLVAMMMRGHIRPFPTGEHILVHKDLLQASAIVACLIVAGSLLFYIILS